LDLGEGFVCENERFTHGIEDSPCIVQRGEAKLALHIHAIHDVTTHEEVATQPYEDPVG
jgi:hypothetical protein